MNIFFSDDVVGRFEHSHADLVEEIRLMAEANREHGASVVSVGHPSSQRSLIARLFSRGTPERRAA